MVDVMLSRITKPTKKDLDEDISWLCGSLGLSQARDTSNMSLEVFKIILCKGEHALTPELIARELNIAHQRALYHIRALIKAGVVVRVNKHIELREGSMTRVIDELQSDTDKIFSDMRKIAADVDETLGLENR